MFYLFKHLAVRLWTALVIGSLAALVLLPPLSRFAGPAWMLLPGLCLMVAVYWLTGVVFAAMGRHRVERLVGEANVWERAGMTREARQAMQRAEATVDSFYFSPRSRRAPADRLLAQMARFQLAQTAPASSFDSIIGAYLQHFPRDREAAVKWLDRMLDGRAVTSKSHDIAARIGTAHPDDAVIQRMLAQFYLTERRCDFAALQTYEKLIASGKPLAGDLLGRLADLFLSQQRADRLALSVYLALHQRGGRHPYLLDGIAACCRVIQASPLTLSLLEAADAVLDGIDADRRRQMAATFLPEAVSRKPMRRYKKPRPKVPAIGPLLRKGLAGLTGLGGLAGRVAAGAFHRLWTIRRLFSSRRTKWAAKWAAMGVFVIAVGWLVINTALHLGTDFKAEEKAPEPMAVSVTDPFTLQVAAYLKETDARHYVEQLKAQGIDAYWTRATGGNQTWYQVRISHFKTKAAAREVGEDLKKRQRIGDYYVANYKRPDVP